jgi:AcrR family transcriptional regulator
VTTFNKKVEDTKPLSKSALRRIREKEIRYETILRAAEELFVNNGYHHTSVENIAEKVEVSIGTVYFYFKNKEALLIKLFAEGVYHLRLTLGTAFLNAQNPYKGFEAAGMAFFEKFCVEHPEKVVILFKETVGQSRSLEEKRKEILKKLTEDVNTALKKVGESTGIHYKNEHSSRVIAVGILGIYERVAYQYLMWADDTDKTELTKIGRDAVDFIMGGVKGLC